MSETLHIGVIIISMLALWQGAEWTVASAARLARHFGISELVIGLTVVAIGTSAPEFAVSIGAALKGSADIAIANIVGSNIFNLGFILGFVILFKEAPTTRTMVWRDGSMLVASGLLLLVFLITGGIGRIEGALLLALLIGYIIFLYVRKDVDQDENPTGDYRWYDGPRIALGLACIVLGAHFMVESATVLARAAGVSEWIIGISIVAIGTSMPEFVTSFVAIVRKHHGISIGNLIGSDLFNLLGVIGVAAILRPLAQSEEAILNVAVMAGFMILVFIMMRTGWRLSRREGIFLLVLTALRWLVNVG